MRKMQIAAGIAVILAGFSLFGLDTMELYGVGESDFELYGSYEGVGSSERGFMAETVIGYGIIPKLSGFLTVDAGATESFGNPWWEISFGLFSTAYDSDYFDFDVYFQASTAFSLTLGTELNFDFKPDLELAGLYLRVEESVFGLQETGPDPAWKAQTAMAVTAGVYYTFLENFQLLAEFDFSLYYTHPQGENLFQCGDVALGFNYAINDSIELISQVAYTIPQQNQPGSVGFSVGFVGTIGG